MRTGKDTAPRAFASLRFTGICLDPNAVSVLLGSNPTTSYNQGELYVVGRQRKEQIRKFGLWLFDTDTLLSNSNLQKHIDIIQNLLTNDVAHFWNDTRFDTVNKWVRDNKVDMDVSLFWRGSTSYPLISSEFEEVVRSMGGKLEKDISNRKDDQECQTQIFA